MWPWQLPCDEMEEGCAMLNDESFEKHVSQGDHEGNLEAADEDGFESVCSCSKGGKSRRWGKERWQGWENQKAGRGKEWQGFASSVWNTHSAIITPFCLISTSWKGWSCTETCIVGVLIAIFSITRHQPGGICTIILMHFLIVQCHLLPILFKTLKLNALLEEMKYMLFNSMIIYSLIEDISDQW